MKVFLSHSSADKVLARRLGGDLEKANIKVWLDQWEIGVGDEFTPCIEKGVDESAFVIVLLTRASVNTPWVTREWRRKVDEEFQTNRVAVVPVRGEPCEIPDFLAQRSHADISGGSYPLGFRHLLTILRYYSDERSINVPESTVVTKRISPDMLWIVTPIGLEVSGDLIPIFEPDKEGASRFLDQLAPRMRDALREEFGFAFPGIRVRGNETNMPPRSALIMIDEIPEVMLEVGRNEVLVDATVAELAAHGISGELRADPTTGRARARIAAGDRNAARAAGLATWDAAEFLFFALQTVVRRMARLFLDLDGTHCLVESFAPMAPDLVARSVPKSVSWFELTDILRRLVDEEIGIGDIGRILESLTNPESDSRDTVLMTEQVRHALRGEITAKFTRGRATLPVLRVDPEIDRLISNAIQRTSAGAYLALDPRHTEDILAAVRAQVHSLGPGGAGMPILVTRTDVRPYIRKIVSLEFPSLPVLSRQDLDPDLCIQPVAQISIGQLSRAETSRAGETLV